MMNSYTNARHVDRDRAEAELAQHLKKATTPDEAPPKQKHVRGCIVFTWDFKSSSSFWQGIQVQPLADEIQSFKALIIIHKVIHGGHPNVLKESFAQTNFIRNLSRNAYSNDTFGYGPLIRGYVSYIMSKLEFHRMNPEFNASFDYQEYISLKGTHDPNEGYEKIQQLMDLQDKQEQFHKMVLHSLMGSPLNECKISALVPLVEESHGIYIFIKSMLTAMHKQVESHDALAPLRSKFNNQHYNLRKFYYECSQIRFLTSLIEIPVLSQEPPAFIEGERAMQRQVATPPPPPPVAPTPQVDFFMEQRLEIERQQQMERERAVEQQRQLELQRQQQQREYEEQLRLQRQREEMERQQMQQNQMQSHVHGRIQELEYETFNLKNQHERDQMTMSSYQQKMNSLEQQMAQLTIDYNHRESNSTNIVRSLEDQVNMWKSKYDSLAKLYATLRQEHLELLKKYKEVSAKVSQADQAIQSMNMMRQDVQTKHAELLNAQADRDRVRTEMERLKTFQQSEIDRLRRELEDSTFKINEIGRSKGEEVSRILTQFNNEKSDLERKLSDQQAGVMNLQNQLDASRRELDNLKITKDEEIAVLQAGMDQTLMALQQVQENTSESEGTLQRKLANLTTTNAAKLNKILDSIYQSCIDKINLSVFELESAGAPGNVHATPESTLTLIEGVNTASNDFAAVMFKFFSEQAEHHEVIANAINFSQLISQLLFETKGVSRLANDQIVDELIQSGCHVGRNSQHFFGAIISSKLLAVPVTQRPEVVARANQDVQASLSKVTGFVEQLVIKEAQAVTVSTDDEIGDVVEREMRNAANAINDAAARLAELMKAPSDPTMSHLDRQVHSAILDSALAITNAIGRLIQCATQSQQEIVSQGKGGSTNAAFYKKNNRWTEGLISAAKAVAMATNLLVETADGVIHGTHSLEQLIVASNQVAAATAQLVAASRVKADLHSKTQLRLEEASKEVTSASKALVKAVKAIAAKQLKDKEAVDYSKIHQHEFKVKEMEKQVEILRLEKELTNSREQLAEMRKFSYHNDDEESYIHI